LSQQNFPYRTSDNTLPAAAIIDGPPYPVFASDGRSLHNFAFTTVTPNGGPGGDGGDYSSVNTAIQNMPNGGTVYIIGIHTEQITIPANLSFYFLGQSLPTLPYARTSGSTLTTPSDGTQIRCPSSVNSAGGTQGIFTKTGGTKSGFVKFTDLAIMPAWGTTTNSTNVYCIVDTSGQGYWSYETCNVVFMPYGWLEAGSPIPSNGGNNRFLDANISLGGSGTSWHSYGGLWFFGMLGSQFLLTGWRGFDSITIEDLFLNNCYVGPCVGAASGFTIKQIRGFCVTSYYLAVVSDTQGNMINEIDKIFVEGNNIPSSALIQITGTPKTALVWVHNVQHWTVGKGSSNLTSLPAVTTLDSTNLIYPCLYWTTRQTFIKLPYPTSLATPFGGSITNFINSANSTIGANGASSTITSGTTYTVTSTLGLSVQGFPIDVTIGAGTSQTITTKDEFGNIIDNAVATLTHRLLFPTWTITVTATTVGTVTVYQATVGNVQAISGTSASPVASVNYVVMKRMYVSSSGGTGVSISYSSLGLGNSLNTLESSLASITHYKFNEGDVLNFGAFSVAPSTTVIQT
jgi:hypothetical protein